MRSSAAVRSDFVQELNDDQTRADELDRCEETHWWYVALRDLLTRLVRSEQFGVPRDATVLDVGCGAGANLRLLGESLQPAYLGGFDVNEHCLAAASRKCPAADVYQSDLRQPEFRRSQYDLITCCDVLCAVGVEHCDAAFAELAERLTPQGRLILHLPAYPWLLGEHDAAVGNIERYRADAVASFLARARLVPELTSYRMCLAFPAVAAVRWLRRAKWLQRAKRRDVAATPWRSDLARSQRGGRWWGGLAALENAALCRGLRWPFGSSLVIVARRM